MCKFLTGKARLQQTDRKRVWKLLDNELYRAKDGNIYIAPRNMLTDNFTIPLWISVIAGSPVDYDTRCSHVHDELCYTREALLTTLTEKELRDKGFLRFSEKNNMWVCEDIPVEYLVKRKVGKWETDNLLYECLEAAGEPFLSRIMIRFGVFWNIGWYWDILTHKVFKLDLERVYEEAFWEENVPKR